jgi:hypothetical protein
LNFLLHAHLASLPEPCAEASVGATLPDLWRVAHRRARPPLQSTLPVSPGIQRGLAHHAEADRWFHDHEALASGEALLLSLFQREQLTAPRLRLLAHPLWELCLDGALVRSRGASTWRRWLHDTWRESAQAREQAHLAIAARLGPEGTLFAQRITRVERELLDGPWLDAYTHGEGLAWCLDAMRARSGLPRVPVDELQRLALALEETRPVADQSLRTLLASWGLAAASLPPDKAGSPAIQGG